MTSDQTKQIEAVEMILDAQGIVKALREEYEEQLSTLRGQLLTAQGESMQLRTEFNNLQCDVGRLIHEMDELRRPGQPMRPAYSTMSQVF